MHMMRAQHRMTERKEISNGIHPKTRRQAVLHHRDRQRDPQAQGSSWRRYTPEAEAAYARALVSLEVNGGYVEPTKKTVAEFFAEWLSDDVSINTHKNTVRSYRSSLRITFALPSATASFALSVRRCSNSS